DTDQRTSIPMFRTTLLVFTTSALLAGAGLATAAQPGQGVRGVVTDSSDAALPGVVVTAALDGHVVARAVTDAAGTYEPRPLPSGDVRLVFQLDGFASADAPVVVHAGAVASVSKRLELAPVTETVMVVGRATDVPPPAPRLPPLPAVTPVAAHDRDSVCGPAKPGTAPAAFGTIPPP